MADTIVKKFVIDTGESEQNLKELNTQLNATSSAINKGAESIGNVAKAEEAVTTSTKSLKAELRSLQAQLAATEPNSAKYRELSAAAGELKDKIKDASEAVGTQAGGAFERVSGSLGLVTSRITSLDFTGAAEGAKQLAVNIGQVKPGDITAGFRGLASTLGSIGKALLTNPLFLIGGAIAAAVAYSDELFSLIDGVTSADEKRLAAQREGAALSKQQLDAIGEQENILRLQGRSEKEILQLKIAAAQQAILDQRAVIETLKIQKQAQVDAAERNAKITSGILQFLTAPLQILTGAVDYILLGLNKVGIISDETFAGIGSLRENFNRSVTSLLFDPAEVAQEGDATIAEAERTLQQLENTQAGFQLSIKQMNEKAASDRKTAEEKATADRINAEKEVSDLLNQLYEENLKEFEDAEKAKTQAALDEAQKRAKAAEEYEAAITALRAEQDAANLTQDEKDIIAIDNKYLALREKAIQAGESTVEVDAAYKAALEQQEADSAAKRIANEQAVQDAKLSLTSDALGAINGLIGAFSKGDENRARTAFRIQKAVSIAQATIDTYKGANAIFASAAANPTTVLFPGQPFIAAAAAIAAGIANVATIAKQKFEGSTSGGNPGGINPPPPPGGNEPPPAQFNPFAAQFINNRPGQVLPRAYVLAGDVTNQQQVRENVENLSRIG